MLKRTVSLGSFSVCTVWTRTRSRLISACSVCLHRGLFQLFWEKAPGLNWEKYAAFRVILGIFKTCKLLNSKKKHWTCAWFISRSKLQRRSESNSVAIFQMNSFPGEIFLSFRLGFWGGGNWEKRRIIWIGNGAYYWSQVIGRKGPEHIFGNDTFNLEQAR